MFHINHLLRCNFNCPIYHGLHAFGKNSRCNNDCGMSVVLSSDSVWDVLVQFRSLRVG